MLSSVRSISRRLLRYHAAGAMLAAAALTTVAWQWNTLAASGSDAYGYVSEADLWLRGNLHVDQSFVASVPWPHAALTFSTLAYQPSPDGTALVPTYSPGLPMMMALAKAAFGPCAVFAVVPALAGVLVLATYGIGRAIGRPLVGLAAAVLVASSPTVLFMSMMPMSDVPAAAMWTLSIALLLVGGTAAAAGAGLSTAIAILVRPNLAPLCAILAIWIAWRDVVRPDARNRRWIAIVCLAAGPALGVALVALVYARLYGSPLNSGYGSLSHIFGFSSFIANLRAYGGWLVSTETPIALLGLAAMTIPLRALWTTSRARDAIWLFAPFTAAVWFIYLTYRRFDAWWYLRFLLPTWPLMAIGTVSVLAFVSRPLGRWTTAAAAVLVVVLAGHGVEAARDGHAFVLWQEQSEYLEASRAVASYAGPGDVVFAREFGGSIRYYSGRLTLTYSAFDPEWLDRAVAWLDARGHHAYFLLTSDEVGAMRRDFARSSRLARLDWTPLLSIRGGDALLFDAVPRTVGETPPEFPPLKKATCQAPKPLPTLANVRAVLE